MNSTELAKKARLHCVNMVYEARASHIASALSIIDILSVLYQNILNVFPSNPKNSNRDRFILSKGHACVGVYALLFECGFINNKMLDCLLRCFCCSYNPKETVVKETVVL